MNVCIKNKNVLTTIATVAMFGIPFLAPTTIEAGTIRWQPTHKMNYKYYGNCRLQSEKITVTLHPFFAEVEEEATIQTTGTVPTGDSTSLEIFGDFKLSEGAALRSMLLWNGNVLLKAKLRDKKSADSLYAEVVGRDTPRDPAIISGLGEGNYEFKIYPVAINKERKIRILYSIPLTPMADGIHFNLNPAFASGSALNPTTIPVKVIADSCIVENCVLAYSSTKKPLQLGAVYNIPQIEFNESSTWDYTKQKYIYSGGSIEIVVNKSVSAKASSSVIKSGRTAGYYTGIITEAPKEFKEIVERDILQIHAIQMMIPAGDENIIADNVALDAPMGLYLKTKEPWAGLIKWIVYNPTSGKSLFTYDQKLTPELDTTNSPTIPLLWAAKYSFASKNGDLGGLYGFVDQRMSLLALEADSLRGTDVAKYQPSGVPLLNPSEIIVDAKLLPSIPENFAIIETSSTGLKEKTAVEMPNFTVKVVNGSLEITAGTTSEIQISIAFYNLKGRLIQENNEINLTNGKVSIPLNNLASGTYILKIAGSTTAMQTIKFMIP